MTIYSIKLETFVELPDKISVCGQECPIIIEEGDEPEYATEYRYYRYEGVYKGHEWGITISYNTIECDMDIALSVDNRYITPVENAYAAGVRDELEDQIERLEEELRNKE